MQENSRWWEFYFVRYAIGTLTGAAIVNQAGNINPDIGKLIFLGIDPGKEIFAGASLQLGYGLLFCYIASIPILVWHAARFSFPFSVQEEAPESWLAKIKEGGLPMWLGLFLFFLFAILILVQIFTSLFLFFSRSLVDQDFLIVLSASFFLAVLVPEYLACMLLMLRKKQIYIGMRRLAKARKEDRNEGGFIDSYRHMREHGNSILIVLLEIILGGTLLGMLHVITEDNQIADKASTFAASSMPLLIFWALPGAGVWLLATWIERRFAFDDGEMSS